MDINNKSIIFLDIDGVLNCELLYKVPRERPYPLSEICLDRVKLLNDLCEEINAVVVISSSWRHSGINYCRNTLKECGATFEIIDITPDMRGIARGNEIAKWLQDNIKPETYGCFYFDFKKYVIIDDDSDMLLNQKDHFFQTDSYSGLNYTHIFKIKKFLNSVNNIPNEIITKNN